MPEAVQECTGLSFINKKEVLKTNAVEATSPEKGHRKPNPRAPNYKRLIQMKLGILHAFPQKLKPISSPTSRQ